MLGELRIHNFAVIDEVRLELVPGLNVLTGETGAGKSIILNALAVISGNRVTSDIIRHGHTEASVEALFEALPESVAGKIRQAGFEVEDGIVIKRVINRSGRNRIYLGGSLCSLSTLSEVGGSLVHIYGQHEHQTLLRAETHLGILDAFGGLTDSANDMREKFRILVTTWESLRRVRELVEGRKKDRALLAAQMEEIAHARLRVEEEQELQSRKNVLLHAEKLYQGCREGEELLYEGESALVGRLGRYGTKLRELARIDRELKSPVELLDGALAQLEEANLELRRHAERVHFEPGALDQVEDRLAEIHRLKRKYNGSVEDILRMHDEAAMGLKALDRGAEEIPALERAFDAARQTAWEVAGALSQERQRVAKQLKNELERELKSLGMPGVVFEVRFFDRAEIEDEPPFVVGKKTLCAHGVDEVEFFFSPNPGEPPKPLAKIASGGELSRLMLAIKSLVLMPGDIPTLLFDEVDAGIGGGVAEIVGKKLKQVALAHQVLCVTHLPQIAALADSHCLVKKEVIKGRTLTTVKALTDTERVEEVARMLGGLKITEKTRRHAEEMVGRK